VRRARSAALCAGAGSNRSNSALTSCAAEAGDWGCGMKEAAVGIDSRIAAAADEEEGRVSSVGPAEAEAEAEEEDG
jgi:hypothetical protein